MRRAICRGSRRARLTACSTDNGSCNLNALIQRNNQRITSLITALGSPLQAGGNVANTGTFAVQAAQSGTWNIGSVTTLPALVAGSAIIGKVGIDQTTVGTTSR
jgi:hypothetical protein